MPSSGLFIMLYDEETLTLYLDRGIYGFLMKPILDGVSPQSRHYAALADYACAREGSHVFFFRKRKITYGGQVTGSKDHGSFYLNGPYSPLGKEVGAHLCWDESQRSRYTASDKKGIFGVPDEDGVNERCQPYLLMFKDKLGFKGKTIQSDQLYFELGNYRYPLPSNSIQRMSFCTLTPRETDITLELLEKESTGTADTKSAEEIHLEKAPIQFKPELGISSLSSAFQNNVFVNEAHLETSILANPAILPKELRPGSCTLCRQVPISPFKPSNMDRADICYFSDEDIEDGTIPNTLIELKKKRAGRSAILQVQKYLKWLYLVLGNTASEISVYILAPSFSRSKDILPKEYRDQLNLVEIGNESQSKLANFRLD